MQPPINGTEQRLEKILEELQALRRLLEKQEDPPASGAPILLREPARRGRPKKERLS